MTTPDTRTIRNERLTQVGPETPMGRYQRCFWLPIAASIELESWPIKRVRVLGEDLALFRTENGTLGLVADRCPHRGASLSCGMTDGSGIRCAYHGWKYEADGRCVDTPAEPESSKLKDRISIHGYPVQEMKGMLWAYLGKQPAPLLPRYEHFVADGWNGSVGVSHLPCNWLQCAENGMDSFHLEQLHTRFGNWVRGRRGLPPLPARRQVRVAYEPFELGIIKKRLYEGDSEDSHEWTQGHPLIFPGHLLVPISADWVQYQFRLPVDDTNTIMYWYDAKRCVDGETPTAQVPIWVDPWQTADGSYIPDNIHTQDMMVWITQGSITDHTLEHLGESDRGVTLYRRMLLDQVARVEQGLDPDGLIRDPARNTPFIELPGEKEIRSDLSGAAVSARHAMPGKK